MNRALLALVVVAFADTCKASEPDDVVGTWHATDRHVAMGSLYQPVHGVRKRVATIEIRRDGQRLVGFAVHPHPEQITGQERWKGGRTEFRRVALEDGHLMLEWDFDEWYSPGGPIAVEQKKLDNKGSARVEAVLKADRLVGTWRLLLADGSEAFRGEWEATRAAAPSSDQPQP